MENMLIDLIEELGANYSDSDRNVIRTLIQDAITIATETTNLTENDTRLYPYIKKAVKSAYLSRGAEGLQSRSEGSISASYLDITEALRQDLVRGGLRRCY